MSRSFMLMITLAVVGAIALYFGWFHVSTSSSPAKDKVKVELTLDKGKLKEDAASAAAKARDLGKKTTEEVRDVARKIGNSGDSKSTWTLEPSRLELTPGTTGGVTITRSGTDLKAMQAGLFPSAGSNLRVSGGQFAEGAASATLTVEAPKDAHDGQITIVADGKSESLDVKVIPQAAKE